MQYVFWSQYEMNVEIKEKVDSYELHDIMRKKNTGKDVLIKSTAFQFYFASHNKNMYLHILSDISNINFQGPSFIWGLNTILFGSR